MNKYEENIEHLDNAKALMEKTHELIESRNKEWIIFLIMGGVPWVAIAQGLALGTILCGLAGLVQLFGMVALVVTFASWAIETSVHHKKIDKHIAQANANLSK